MLHLFKNIFILFCVLFLSFITFDKIETVLTPAWWKNADIKDIKARFEPNWILDRQDENGMSFLMMALTYSSDPEVALFFINERTPVFLKDKNGQTLYDLAMQNPFMLKPAQILKEMENKKLQILEEYLRKEKNTKIFIKENTFEK